MSTVVMHAVVSVDGFIADDHDEVGSLFDWYFSGDRPLFDGTETRHPNMSISEPSYGYVKPFWNSIRCGRRTAPVRPHQRLGGEAARVRAPRRRVPPAEARQLASRG